MFYSRRYALQAPEILSFTGGVGAMGRYLFRVLLNTPAILGLPFSFPVHFKY